MKRMTDREYYWSTVKVLIRMTPSQKERASGALLVSLAITGLTASIVLFGWLSH